MAAAVPSDDVQTLAARAAERFDQRLHLGTSSWSFPGWQGLVWAKPHSPTVLARQGLAAYAQHPLFRCVSLDRSFYGPLDAGTFADYAAQVPDGFRFVVKAPSTVTDATLREGKNGKALQPNLQFLDPRAALHEAVLPAAQGLRDKLGVLVFQLSPLPFAWLQRSGEFIERLDALWATVVPALPPGAACALEVRDAALLTPALAASLKRHGVRYCLGLHDRMPTVAEQLPMLRAMWPGDLVCRWNLQRGLQYAAAKEAFEPFDRLQAPDAGTRAALARVLVGTLAAGYRAYVTINNKAEGSAPLSVVELARETLRLAE